MNVEPEPLFVERRMNIRYNVGDMFAVPSSNPSRLCQIIDLSRDGMAFCYFNSKDWKTKSSRTNILLPDDGFCLDKLPVKNVSDINLPSPIGSDTMRRCGVKFGRLKSSQAYWLKYLLEKHGIDPNLSQPAYQETQTASK
jgi:hypothetical protein